MGVETSTPAASARTVSGAALPGSMGTARSAASRGRLEEHRQDERQSEGEQQADGHEAPPAVDGRPWAPALRRSARLPPGPVVATSAPKSGVGRTRAPRRGLAGRDEGLCPSYPTYGVFCVLPPRILGGRLYRGGWGTVNLPARPAVPGLVYSVPSGNPIGGRRDRQEARRLDVPPVHRCSPLAFLLLVSFVRQLGGVLLTFFLAAGVLAYVLNPLVRRLEGWRVPRIVAVLGVFLIAGYRRRGGARSWCSSSRPSGRCRTSFRIPRPSRGGRTRLLEQAASVALRWQRVADLDQEAESCSFVRSNAPSAGQAFRRGHGLHRRGLRGLRDRR